MDLSPTVDALIKEFEEPKVPAGDGTHLTVSRTVSILAVLYEKARNAVEFREEHLVRRAAIERILKRRILLNGGSSTIAESLVTELLWARYIDSSIIDQQKIDHIQKIIDRYLLVQHTLYAGSQTYEGVSWESLLGVASAEIEETLVSAKKRLALNNFFYQAVRPKIKIPERDEQYINLQTYVAVERAFAQSDEALITYHLVKIVHPGWFTHSHEKLGEVLPQFIQYVGHIQKSMKDPVSESVFRYIRKQTPAFLLLRDFFTETDGKAREIIQTEATFEQKLTEIASAKYKEIGSKVRRAVVRSFIYIFLTKMVFALALEAPYDSFVAHRVAYIPLTINALFPPFLMILVAGFIGTPKAENTERLITRIKKIIYHFDSLKEETDVYALKPKVRRPFLTAVFSLVYLVTFAITFSLIHFILSILQFNIVSQVIFVFFVALVSFFAYRIKQSAREYEVIDRQGFLDPLVDFILLPVVRAGHFLSREIAKINIFIFLFDFILEAPLKVIFEVVEEWIRFVRSKKEEII